MPSKTGEPVSRFQVAGNAIRKPVSVKSTLMFVAPIEGNSSAGPAITGPAVESAMLAPGRAYVADT